jgi:mono/diheme cytochrome c family protein
LKAIFLTAIALLAAAGCTDRSATADPNDAAQLASGSAIYASQCAACHGANLEGQPDWKSRKPNGRMPAPPHDDSGHTWHHPDDILFGITKFGLRPPYGPSGYQSDMPAFGGTLTDRQIRDVLAYIKSRWSPRVQQAQAQIQREYRDKKD